MQRTDRIPALDGLRGVAILLVLMAHLRHVVGSTPVDHAVDTVLLSGYSGVDLFFVLSGFLITGVLLDAKGDEHYFRNFYARRALRILPLYYGTVAFLLWIYPILHPSGIGPHIALERRQWWYWLHLTNIGALVPDPWRLPYNTGHFWSLALEEQFYFLWPIVVLRSSDRTLLKTCAVGIVVAAVLRLIMSAANMDDAWSYRLLFTRMDTLLGGAAVAVLARQPDGLPRLRRAATRWGLPAALILATTFTLWEGMHIVDLPFRTIGYSAAVVMYGALLTLAVAGPFADALSHPVLRFFGKYSYAMYVFHPMLLTKSSWVGTLADRATAITGWTLVGTGIYYVLGVGLVSVVAYLSWHLYERWFLALKRFVPRREPLRLPTDVVVRIPLVADAPALRAVSNRETTPRGQPNPEAESS